MKAVEDGPALQSIQLHMGKVCASVQHCANGSRIERRIEAGDHQASSLAPTDPDSPQELVGQQLSRGGSNSLFRKILPRFRTLLDHLG